MFIDDTFRQFLIHFRGWKIHRAVRIKIIQLLTSDLPFRACARIIERAFYHPGYLITIIHFYQNSTLLSGIRSASLYKCVAGYEIWETNYSEHNTCNSLRPARRMISRDVAIPIVRAMEYARAIQRKVFVFCISHFFLFFFFFFCASVRARALVCRVALSRIFRVSAHNGVQTFRELRGLQ